MGIPMVCSLAALSMSRGGWHQCPDISTINCWGTVITQMTSVVGQLHSLMQLRAGSHLQLVVATSYIGAFVVPSLDYAAGLGYLDLTWLGLLSLVIDIGMCHRISGIIQLAVRYLQQQQWACRCFQSLYQHIHYNHRGARGQTCILPCYMYR